MSKHIRRANSTHQVFADFTMNRIDPAILEQMHPEQIKALHSALVAANEK
jgi:hypothetical protein